VVIRDDGRERIAVSIVSPGVAVGVGLIILGASLSPSRSLYGVHVSLMVEVELAAVVLGWQVLNGVVSTSLRADLLLAATQASDLVIRLRGIACPQVCQVDVVRLVFQLIESLVID
jgi:hypothetical protein